MVKIIMKALILAAGYATRLYPLTKDKPKALLPVAGRAIIDYIIDEIETIDDIDEIAVISNDLFYSHFEKWLETSGAARKKLIRIINDNTTGEDNKLGAIRDMKFAIDEMGIDDDIVVIAGDNLFTNKLIDSYNLFKAKGLDMVLAKNIPDISELQRMAVGILDENGIIVDMEEKPKNPKSDIAFFATYFYKRETLKMIEQYLNEGNPPDAPGYFPSWLYTRKPVLAHLFTGECYDIGTFDSYDHVREIYENR